MLRIESVQPLRPVDRDQRHMAVAVQLDAHLAHTTRGFCQPDRRQAGSPAVKLPRNCPFIKHAFDYSEQIGIIPPMSVSEQLGPTPTGVTAEQAKPKPDPGFSQSIERGLAILSSFKPNRPLIGVSELAREVGLGRSTTHRYVATLCALGYLEQDPPSRKYRLGPKVIDLGFSAINSMELRAISPAVPPAPQRRDRLHRQHGDPRRHRHHLHRAVP